MTREEVLESISVNVEDQNLVRHMLATEAVMRALAARLGENGEEWGLTGLMHDIDAELTEGDTHSHSLLGADLAREMGASETMAQAILRHNQAHGIPLGTKLDKALYCADPLTGLITAAARYSQIRSWPASASSQSRKGSRKRALLPVPAGSKLPAVASLV